jgi:hypothetical protein
MESSEGSCFADNLATELQKAGIGFDRLDEKSFVFRWQHDSHRLRVGLVLEDGQARIFTDRLSDVTSQRDCQAVLYLNYRVFSFGRLGVDVEDGELRFDGEVGASSEPAVIGAILEATESAFFTLEVLDRLRYSDVSIPEATDATLAAKARQRGLADLEQAAHDAWSRQVDVGTQPT